MAIEDLKFEWTTALFKLNDMVIFSNIAVHEKNDDGEWEERHTPFALEKDELEKENEVYEKSDHEMKYTKPSRILSATGTLLEDSRCRLVLGIPDNNKEDSNLRLSRFDSLKINIQEVSLNDAKLLVRAGHIIHDEAWDDGEGYSIDAVTHAQFYVSTDTFDDIERMLLKPDVSAHININLKGWLHIGYISDKEIYISRDEKQPAELLGVIVKQQVTPPPVEPESDEGGN